MTRNDRYIFPVFTPELSPSRLTATLKTTTRQSAAQTLSRSRSRELSNKTLAIIALFSLVLLAIPQFAKASECQIAIGQRISAQSPADVFSKLSELDAQKGEFETTEDFNRRVENASMDISSPITVQSKFDPDAAQYDADRNILRLFSYSWDNAATGWDEVFTRSNTPNEVRYSSYGRGENLGIGLGQTEDVVDAYEASNSYGASTTVSKITRNVYSVFTGKIDGETEWQIDGTADYVRPDFTLKDTDYVDIPMSIDRARSEKDRLQVVVSFSPKLPFVAEGSRNWSPTIRRPRDTTAYYKVIIGTIHCVGILNPNGDAIHVIYPHE